MKVYCVYGVNLNTSLLPPNHLVSPLSITVSPALDPVISYSPELCQSGVSHVPSSNPPGQPQLEHQLPQPAPLDIPLSPKLSPFSASTRSSAQPETPLACLTPIRPRVKRHLDVVLVSVTTHWQN